MGKCSSLYRVGKRLKDILAKGGGLVTMGSEVA